MSIFMRVRLCEGRRVRDPETNHVLVAGRVYKVKQSSFWLRRVVDEDVEIYGTNEEKSVEPSEAIELAPKSRRRKRKSKES